MSCSAICAFSNQRQLLHDQLTHTLPAWWKLAAAAAVVSQQSQLLCMAPLTLILLQVSFFGVALKGCKGSLVLEFCEGATRGQGSNIYMYSNK